VGSGAAGVRGLMGSARDEAPAALRDGPSAGGTRGAVPNACSVAHSNAAPRLESARGARLAMTHGPVGALREPWWEEAAGGRRRCFPPDVIIK